MKHNFFFFGGGGISKEKLKQQLFLYPEETGQSDRKLNQELHNLQRQRGKSQRNTKIHQYVHDDSDTRIQERAGTMNDEVLLTRRSASS